MTASARKKSLSPWWMLALMTASLTFGAMPTMPWPFASAAIRPATFVPWPGVVVPGSGILVRRAADARDAARGVDVAVQVRVARVDARVDDADEHLRAPARDLVRVGRLDPLRVPLHWREGIAREHRRVGQPASVPVEAPAGGRGDDAPDRGDALHLAVAVEGLREVRVARLGDDDVDLGVGGDDRAAGLLDVVLGAPDIPTVLGIQDDIPLSRGWTSQRERGRSRDREHDKTNG